MRGIGCGAKPDEAKALGVSVIGEIEMERLVR